MVSEVLGFGKIFPSDRLIDDPHGKHSKDADVAYQFPSPRAKHFVRNPDFQVATVLWSSFIKNTPPFQEMTKPIVEFLVYYLH